MLRAHFRTDLELAVDRERLRPLDAWARWHASATVGGCVVSMVLRLMVLSLASLGALVRKVPWGGEPEAVPCAPRTRAPSPSSCRSMLPMSTTGRPGSQDERKASCRAGSTAPLTRFKLFSAISTAQRDAFEVSSFPCADHGAQRDAFVLFVGADTRAKEESRAPGTATTYEKDLSEGCLSSATVRITITKTTPEPHVPLQRERPFRYHGSLSLTDGLGEWRCPFWYRDWYRHRTGTGTGTGVPVPGPDRCRDRAPGPAPVPALVPAPVPTPVTGAGAGAGAGRVPVPVFVVRTRRHT